MEQWLRSNDGRNDRAAAVAATPPWLRAVPFPGPTVADAATELMTQNERTQDADAPNDDRSTDADAGRSRADGSSRRTFMHAAAAGVAGTGLGTVVSGQSDGSTQGDGPGQDIGTPKLEVDGNVLVDPDGNTITLRGLNMAGPKTLDMTASVRGKTAEQAIRYLTNQDEGWYPRILRLPIEPSGLAELTPKPLADYENGDYPIGEFDRDDLEAYCENHLDDAVDLCAERNVYCIIDYHRHWGDGKQKWDDPALDPEVTMFWDFMAERYGDRDHVVFELYNEPTAPGMWGDPANNNWAGTWFDWVEVAQPWLETIREHTDTVVFIGSPSWSESPEGAKLTPETTPDYLQDDFRQFDDPEDNIGFTYHIYPAHNASKQQAWDDASVNGEGVDEVYEEYPLLVTEFGWDGELDGTYTHSSPFFPLEGTTDEFGEAFMNWLESHEAISWTAWCADPIFKPVMIERTFTERTQHDDVDAAGDPYNEELPVYCEDPPCEWGILGEDVGDYNMKAGGFIREKLEELKDENVPEPTGPSAPVSPSDAWTNDVGETTIEMGWDSVSDADTYNVYLGDALEESTSSTTYTITGLEPDTDYEVGVAAENDHGESTKETTTVTTEDDGGDGGDCEDGETETLSDGSTVCDIDGDGWHRDVNGDGSVSNGDITDFFSNQHVDPWDSRTDLFDFDGNDDVGQGDVVELFHYVN